MVTIRSRCAATTVNGASKRRSKTKQKLKLKLIGQDRSPEILFGKDAALEGKMYVRFENSKETFLAAQTIKRDIEKKPEEFRDKKLTDLVTTQVSRVVLKTLAAICTPTAWPSRVE